MKYLKRLTTQNLKRHFLKCCRLFIVINLYLLFGTAYALNGFSDVNESISLDKEIQTVIDQDRIKYHLPALSVSLCQHVVCPISGRNDFHT
jgi:hypothetical protein